MLFNRYSSREEGGLHEHRCSLRRKPETSGGGGGPQRSCRGQPPEVSLTGIGSILSRGLLPALSLVKVVVNGALTPCSDTCGTGTATSASTSRCELRACFLVKTRSAPADSASTVSSCISKRTWTRQQARRGHMSTERCGTAVLAKKFEGPSPVDSASHTRLFRVSCASCTAFS